MKVMFKNYLYIPLKVVPFIFVSINAIAITAATYIITQFFMLLKFIKSLDTKKIKITIKTNIYE